MRKIAVAIGIAMLWVCPQVWAQVSDTQAYFQWMLAVTDNTLTPRMAAHLSTAGLRVHEHEQAAAILQKFKAEELELEASTDDANTDAFASKQAALVQDAIDKLRMVLPLSSFVALDNRVQHEARNIKVSRVVHNHSQLMPVSYGRPQRLGMTPRYTYYHTSAVGDVPLPITASMLSSAWASYFPQWNAANLVDDNTSTVGFSTDTSQAWQSCVSVNLGTPRGIVGLGFFMSAAGSNALFTDAYSDAGVSGSWTYFNDAFAPKDAGWNYKGWPDVGAHQYWLTCITNTPGPGPTINEMQLVPSTPQGILYTTSQTTGTTSCPDGCPPLARHIGWAQVVTADGVVHNTFGPGVYPTSYINVSDSETSVLPASGPNDPPSTTSTTGGVNCTVAGNGFSGTPNTQMDIRFERAITESYISALLDSNGMHPEHIYCIIAATPPDFPGPDEALPGTSSGQVVNIAFLYREWPLGTKETGVPWQLVFPNLQRFGLGYYVVPTMEPDPSGCTMWDNGFRHLPLPTPADPQPSSPW